MTGTVHTISCHKRLTDLLKDHFNGTFIPAAAFFFDEREGALQKAIRIIIPVFVTNLQEKLDAEKTDIFRIAKEFTGTKLDEPVKEYLTNGYVLNKGRVLLTELFDNSLGNTVNAISAFATVKSSTVHSLLSLCTSSALSGLGQAISELHLHRTEVKQYLAFSPEGMDERIPASFTLFFRKWKEKNSAGQKIILPDTTINYKSRQSVASRLLPTVLLIILVFLVYFLTRNRDMKRPEKDTMTNDIHVIGIKSTPEN